MSKLIEGLFNWDEDACESVDVVETEDQLGSVNLNNRGMVSRLLLIKELTMSGMLHLIKDESGDGFYVRCDGSDCRLCGLGYSQVKRIFIPVYNLDNGAVEILRATVAANPKSLLPQLRKVMKHGDRPIVAIRKVDNKRFQVRMVNLDEGELVEAEEVIAEFKEMVNLGAIDILSVVRRFDPELHEDYVGLAETCQRL